MKRRAFFKSISNFTVATVIAPYMLSSSKVEIPKEKYIEFANGSKLIFHGSQKGRFVGKLSIIITNNFIDEGFAYNEILKNYEQDKRT